MQAYLAAAFSLRDPATVANPQLAADLQAAHYEIMRIAVGEMRHVRAVRDVLASRATPPFDPPLRVATRVPGQGPTDAAVMLLPAALTPDVLDVFIDIEGPNVAVDGLYARILATLEVLGNTPRAEQAIRRIMTEGEDHQKAFKAIREWLRPYTPAQYLRAATLTVPPAGDATNAALQGEYLAILESLHTGYSQTTPATPWSSGCGAPARTWPAPASW
jgi:hypothetical protein